jgi:UDP-N-acetylglucosamine diphosphorylase/glucosamine-1-phosphate N-acetyltransferase
MSIVLFDGVAHQQLLPLTYTKPVAALRVGIFTIQEKWNYYLGTETSIRTKDYLTEKFKGNNAKTKIGVFAGLLPDEDIVDTINNLEENQLLMHNDQVIAICPLPAVEDMDDALAKMTVLKYEGDLNIINRPWDIFKLNGEELEKDFEIVIAEKEPEEIDASNTILGKRVFIEKGAKVTCSILNSTTGPIYIAKNAEVMEGCMIRGSFALLENAVLKMGAKIYGPTTIGPFCKVGGEVGNSVMQGYSNKGHDGYMGNSVIGEWCNLGADTNTSNLKNNYGNVKVWSYKEEALIDSEEQFCGLIMGDHSKCGINTMFNTGTIVGAFANIFGGDFPDKHIPSFSWGGKDGFTTYKLDKSYEVAKQVMSRRSIELSGADKEILKTIFVNTEKFRG